MPIHDPPTVRGFGSGKDFEETFLVEKPKPIGVFQLIKEKRKVCRFVLNQFADFGKCLRPLKNSRPL